MTDSCDELLAPPPPPDDDAALRDKLLLRTLAVVRRRWWLPRLAVAAALGGGYFAGLLSVCLLLPRGESVPTPVGGWTTLPPPPAAVGSWDVGAEPAAVLLEEQAFDSPQDQAVLYRTAGDRYAETEGDVQAALRCYRNALDAGSDQDLTIEAEDNWLLMVLKDARQKEKQNANRN